MPNADVRGAAVAGVVAALLASVSGHDARSAGPTVITSWPISPAVVATFIAHGDPVAVTPGQPIPRPTLSGPVTLDLLVLWRGSPGWFLQGDHKQESGGGDGSGHINVHLEEGGCVLDLTLDLKKRVALVADHRVVLGDANILLVEGVDVPGGLTVAGTRTVEPRVDRPPDGLYGVFRSAEDLVPFLRCEARLPDPPTLKDVPPGVLAAAGGYMQQVLDASCARMQVK